MLVIHPTPAAVYPYSDSRMARRIIKCGCGDVVAMTAIQGNAKIADRLTSALIGSAGVVALSNGFAPCGCGRMARVTTVKATRTDHICGAKCRNSKGHVCDCSCGGQFHGAGFERAA